MIRSLPALCSLLVLVFAAAGLAQEPSEALAAPAMKKGFVGRWEGALKPIGIEVQIEISRRAEAWDGHISIPVQRMEKRPLVGFELKDGELRFEIQDVPGEPTFRARLAESGDRLGGTMVQGGGTMTFDFVRGETAVERARASLEGLDAWVAKAMEKLEIPGLALAVVVDDQVLVARGYGMADVETERKADARTRFAIGSSTKAFTTFGLARLAQEGKLSWDDAARDYLPELRLQDEAAAIQLTPRDMVTHRSGLPRHDLLWYASSKVTPADILKRLPHLEPNATLREAWQYNNLMYVLAGHLAARLDGGDWEDHLRRRVLEPAGMKDTLFSFEEARKGPGLASPYGDREGEQRKIPYRDIRHVGPAGSILSNARDMARWLRLMLGEGEIDGERLLDRDRCQELMRPQMVMPSGPVGDDGIDAYAHGWMVDYFRGHPRVHHGGNIDGFSTQVTLFPGEGFGVAVMVNQDGSPAPSLVIAHIADGLLDLERRERLSGAARARRMARKQTAKAEENRDLERKKDTKPGHALSDYVGTYEHPGYGLLAVTQDESGLRLAYGDLPASLEHWHYETFIGRSVGEDRTLAGIQFLFVTDVAGEVAAVEVRLEPTVAAIRFDRKADADLDDPKILDRYVGRYALPGGVVRVVRSGRTLKLTVPGQPTYTLVPVRAARFDLKGLEGFSVVFDEEDGEVAELRFLQPNGVFRAKRKR